MLGKRSFVEMKSMASIKPASTTMSRVVSDESSSLSTKTEHSKQPAVVTRHLSTSPTEDKHLKKRTRKGSIDIIEKPDIIKKEVKLPDPTQNVDPDTFLAQLIEAQYGFTLKQKDALSMEDDFFPEITEEQIAAYDIKLVAACRENDVDTLKSLIENEGQSAECCNRFGESLLHMACRRGFKDIVEYFLTEPKLSVRIRDDCGRTPLHDCCWNPQAQTEMMKWLIERDPCLLLLTDKRGSTPFAYARPQDWPTWRQFLLDNRSCFDALEDCQELFS